MFWVIVILISRHFVIYRTQIAAAQKFRNCVDRHTDILEHENKRFPNFTKGHKQIYTGRFLTHWKGKYGFTSFLHGTNKYLPGIYITQQTYFQQNQRIEKAISMEKSEIFPSP